jgi:hypothetical protein
MCIYGSQGICLTFLKRRYYLQSEPSTIWTIYILYILYSFLMYLKNMFTFNDLITSHICIYIFIYIWITGNMFNILKEEVLSISVIIYYVIHLSSIHILYYIHILYLFFIHLKNMVTFDELNSIYDLTYGNGSQGICVISSRRRTLSICIIWHCIIHILHIHILHIHIFIYCIYSIYI